MTRTNTPDGAPALRLHAVAPALSSADVARGVACALTGRCDPPGGWSTGRHGRVLRYGGVTAEVTAAWDGPELRIALTSAAELPCCASELLDLVNSKAGGDTMAGRAPRTDPSAAPTLPAGEQEAFRDAAHRVWRAVLLHRRVPPDACAEIRTPGVLTPLSEPALRAVPVGVVPDHAVSDQAAGIRPTQEPVFVLDHAGPPTPPPGWLLHAWFAPDAGGHHFSVAPSPGGPRLRLRTRVTAQRASAKDILRTWRVVTAEVSARTGPRPSEDLAALLRGLPPTVWTR
ncbi:hypothetical protein [Streptomyces prasinus]|uniref:hypothetical protein n=1 Tax=Streptomyces prasinus TaxID=67345 RepID=UPI0036C35A44